MDRRMLARAGALGFATGLRTFTPITVLSLRGRALSGTPHRLLCGAAAAEFVGDKLPQMPSRLSSRGITARIGSSAASGTIVGGPSGALVAMLGAGLGAFAGFRARRAAARHAPDFVCALIEDGAAVGIAVAAAR